MGADLPSVPPGVTPSAAPGGSQPPQPPAEPSLGGLPELLLFLLAALGLTILIPLAAGILLTTYTWIRDPGQSVGTLFGETLRRFGSDAFFLVPVQLILMAATVGLVYVFVRFLRGLNFAEGVALRKVGAARALQVLFAGILLAFAAAVVNSYLPPQEELPIQKLLVSQTAVLLVLGMAVLAAPLVEELVFRGYIYTLVAGRWGMGAAIVTSGLLFGAIHFPQLWPGYAQMIMLVVVGLAFSTARALTGSTTAAILMHLSYNATLSLGEVFSADFQKLPAMFF